MIQKIECEICNKIFDIQKGVIIPAIVNGRKRNIICCNECFNKNNYEKNIELAKEIAKEDNNEKKD